MQIASTCTCGLRFVPGVPEDDERHEREHAEFLRGPIMRVVRNVPRVGEVEDFPLHLVDERTPFVIRHQLAHVAMVAHRTMSSYPAGYDGTITPEDDQRLYLLADRGDNLFAMALTSLDDHFWKLRWREDGKAKLIDSHAVQRSGFKIARVWVAKDYRGRGIAAKLTGEVLRKLPCEFHLVGWEVPFTPGGRALVQRLQPGDFFACGDPYSVGKVLERDDDE